MTDVAVRHVDSIVVGSGIAGLTAALAHGNCVVVSKSATGEGSSRWAQGGIAAAVGPDDDPRFHADDTTEVSGGLGRAEIATLVTGAAPDQIEWLRSLGADFDTAPDGSLRLGREAGHDQRRIVHANGDATGAEVMRTLVRATVERTDIERLDDTLVVDLLRDGDRVVGVLALHPDDGLVALVSPAVVLATGGIGRLYLHTTNPREVTADGLAMAARAGAVIRDPEFVQFHPTAFHSDLDPMPLLTEALRGEGAQLLDDRGRRYMVDVHADAELAPRDVVARENWRRRREGAIHLDARMIGADFAERFPTVWQITQQAGLDPRVDLLPVSPAEHYHMGGIATDDSGRSSVAGLYACGEAASTGLHGANRLASNSLLEGLVFGSRVAAAMVDDRDRFVAPTRVDVPETALRLRPDAAHSAEIEDLRRTMWDDVGVVRDAAGLTRASQRIAELAPRLATHPEGRNLAEAARLITDAALAREESRGSHFRSDHPETAAIASHSLLHPVPATATRIDVACQPSRAGA